MSFFSSPLKDIDNEIHKAINLELDRQQNQIELIEQFLNERFYSAMSK